MRMKSTQTKAVKAPAGDWHPVLSLVKDGISSLRLLPVVALVLAILAWVMTHPKAKAETTASCVTCEDR